MVIERGLSEGMKNGRVSNILINLFVNPRRTEAVALADDRRVGTAADGVLTPPVVVVVVDDVEEAEAAPEDRQIEPGTDVGLKSMGLSTRHTQEEESIKE
jgi:hypothetical protein